MHKIPESTLATLRSMDRNLLKALYPRDCPEILQFFDQESEPDPTPDASQPRQRPPQAPADPARHARKCLVCSHPQREALEDDFLHWRSPEKLARDYNIPHRSMIYRHLHAHDLFRKRAGRLRHALESIIEQSENCKVTANSVIRAVRAYCCITDDGRWVEPPKQVIYSLAPEHVQEVKP